jgi:hypothetical protein
MEKQYDKLMADKGLWEDLGLVGSMAQVFKRFPAWLDDGGRITAYYIDEGVLPDIPFGHELTGQQVVEFGALMGLLDPEPLDVGVSEDARPYALNPLLKAVLNSSAPAEAL